MSFLSARLDTRPVISNVRECHVIADTSTNGAPARPTLDFHLSSHDNPVPRHNTDPTAMCSHPIATYHCDSIWCSPSRNESSVPIPIYHIPAACTAGTNSGVALHSPTGIQRTFHTHDDSFKFNPPCLAHQPRSTRGYITKNALRPRDLHHSEW